MNTYACLPKNGGAEVADDFISINDELLEFNSKPTGKIKLSGLAKGLLSQPKVGKGNEEIKHVSKDPKVLSGEEAPPTVCGQFKKLMEVSDPKNCEQICAGQLVTF